MMIENDFLRDRVKKIGMGPAMLYLQLLSYCYGEKKRVYPSLKTLSYRMGVSIKTILVYRKVLISHGLIKGIARRKDEKKRYQNTLYQLAGWGERPVCKKDYPKIKTNASPRKESLKWIRRIRQQLQDGEWAPG